MKNIGVALGGGKAFAVNPLLLLTGLAVAGLLIAHAASNQRTV